MEETMGKGEKAVKREEISLNPTPDKSRGM